MKITIDLNAESFEGYFEEKDGTLDFTSAAIDMIIHAFAEKCRWDDEIRNYIKQELYRGFWKEISEFKDKDMVKTIATEYVKDLMKPHNTGSVIITDREKEEIRECVKEAVEAEEMRIVSNIRGIIRAEAQRVVDTVFEDSAIREFIDKPKLTAYIMSNLKQGEHEQCKQP